MSAEKYVLSMYDIRGKQEFIFRSNRLKEIVGGSAIIRDCFDDYLYPVAEQYGKGIFHEEIPFSVKGFQEHIAQGYIGEVVYDGGGNFLVLFRDKETFQEITYDFTRNVYKEIGTLRVLGSCVEIADFDDFDRDRRRLYEQHRRNENRETNIACCATLPIVQVDVRNSQALVDKTLTGSEIPQKVSRESLKKYEKYDEELRENGFASGEKYLDHLVTKKGEESLLAVIYIDGNSMGDKVQKCCADVTSYEDCIQKLREFSADIQEKYIERRLHDIDDWLEARYPADRKGRKRVLLSGGGKKRLVLGAGDEINLICNARDAYEIANIYLKGLHEDDPEASSCAGIAIFHSHVPYADAYRIAEECCESGKRKMKEREVNNVSLLDYHYCQGVIGTSLDAIREHEGESDTSRPWIVNIAAGEQDKMSDCVRVENEITWIKEYLWLFGRSNVKGLLQAAKNSDAELQFEMKRMEAHMNRDKDQEKREQQKELIRRVHGIDIKKLRKLIFDVVMVYDLWFKEG